MTTPASTTAPADALTAPLMLSVSGCRGIVGASFTPITIARYTAAAAHHLRRSARSDTPRIVLARDGRTSGETAAPIVAGTLRAAGCRVIDIGIATTPTAGIMVQHHAADGAVVITASHNPGQWNGIKVITRRGAAPPPEEADAIIEHFKNAEPEFADHEHLGTTVGDDTAAHVHVARILDALETLTPLDAVRAQGFRVLVDPVNGSGARGARLLLEALGAEPILVNEHPVGVFAHPPEPTRENLRSLGTHITSSRAALGVAQDPDADRLALLDATGHYLGEEYTLALAAWSLLDATPQHQRNGVTLAANLSTSRMIDDIAERFGAAVHRTPVGEANVAGWMLTNNAPIGGEGNGGVIWPAVVPIRDSLSAIALVLTLMARTGRSLEDLTADIPAYAIVKRKAPADPQLIPALEPRLTDAFQNARINASDGVRLDLEAPDNSGHAWIHVRPSNTEPIVRLIAEAPTANAATDLLATAAPPLGTH